MLLDRNKKVEIDDILERVNLVIEDFYKLFYETENLALKQGIKCLTTTELHVIEAIGIDAPFYERTLRKTGNNNGNSYSCCKQTF